MHVIFTMNCISFIVMLFDLIGLERRIFCQITGSETVGTRKHRVLERVLHCSTWVISVLFSDWLYTPLFYPTPPQIRWHLVLGYLKAQKLVWYYSSCLQFV